MRCLLRSHRHGPHTKFLTVPKIAVILHSIWTDGAAFEWAQAKMARRAEITGPQTKRRRCPCRNGGANDLDQSADSHSCHSTHCGARPNATMRPRRRKGPCPRRNIKGVCSHPRLMNRLTVKLGRRALEGAEHLVFDGRLRRFGNFIGNRDDSLTQLEHRILKKHFFSECCTRGAVC